MESEVPDGEESEGVNVFRVWVAELRRMQREREEQGLPPVTFDPHALDFQNDPLYFNVFASLGAFAPGYTPDTDMSADVAAGVGFSCSVAACIVSGLGVGRLELLPVIPDYGRTDVHEILAPALAHAFACSTADDLFATCPSDVPHVARVLEAMGFRHQFSREAPFRDRGVIACEFYRLSLDEWIQASARMLALGHEVGAEWADPQDEQQMRYIGFLQAAYSYSNLQRGIDVYNRFALIAGLGPIEAKRQEIPSLLVEYGASTLIH